jgi:hypothetical protein
MAVDGGLAAIIKLIVIYIYIYIYIYIGFGNPLYVFHKD